MNISRAMHRIVQTVARHTTYRRKWYNGYYQLVHPVITPETGKISQDGFTLYLHPKYDNIQRSIYLEAGKYIYEQDIQAWIINNVKEGATVVEVGAHVGLHALTLCKCTGPEGTCILIEPSPDSFQLLVKNLTVNGYQWAKQLNVAVSDHSGDLLLGISRDSAMNTIAADSPYKIAAIHIKSVRLDEIITEEIGTVDLLKIDVEGAEAAVIRSGEDAVRRNQIPTILCEFHPSQLLSDFGTKPQDFLDYIRALRYQIYRLVDGQEHLYVEDTPDPTQRYHLVFRRVV